MKQIIDFIGDVIVKLIVLVGYVLLPFAYVFGAIIGFVQKLRGVKYQTFTKTFEGLGEMTEFTMCDSNETV